MKMNATLTHIKVPLSQLKITTNVRQDFDEAEIAELAQSIRDNGLINAITVKPPVIDEHGDKTYEVIAGGRRIRAHQWLCEHGDDFSMIDCKISTGDMWTIQMVENIQRTDLSPREKEAAIIRALEGGMTQKEIAEKLSKPISYISDIVAGIKVRQVADKAGIKTDSVSTKALAQLRSFDDKELPGKVEKLVESGGRVSDATNILKASRTTLESSKNTDESTIEPTKLSEKDFYDDSLSPEFDGGLIPLFKVLEENQLEHEQPETNLFIKHFKKKIPVKSISYDKKTKSVIVEADEKAQRLSLRGDQAVDFILDEEITAERLIIELSKLPPKTPIKIDGMDTPAIHFYFYPDSHISVLSSRSFSIPHSYAGEPRKPKQQEESARE